MCVSCGKVHYVNPRILVVCTVIWQGKLLMCRGALDPARGKWVPPSGYLEIGETLQEGAARETSEETAVRVEPESLHLYAVTNIVTVQQVAVVFRSELLREPVIHPGPECSEVAFMSEDEIGAVEMAWRETAGNSTQRFFEQERTHKYCIQLVNIGTHPDASYSSREYLIVPDGYKA
jgi:ADP-ribose pyrophosphatase YjhB (NUDIX family)